MSERDGIERAARVAEQIEPPAGYHEHYEIAELSGFDCASSMIAAAIRALPPAEPEEVSEAMIERPRASQFIGWIADRFQEKHVPSLPREKAALCSKCTKAKANVRGCDGGCHCLRCASSVGDAA